MKALILSVVLLTISSSVLADDQSCRSTCYMIGNQQVCNTYCTDNTVRAGDGVKN